MSSRGIPKAHVCRRIEKAVKACVAAGIFRPITEIPAKEFCEATNMKEATWGSWRDYPANRDYWKYILKDYAVGFRDKIIAAGEDVADQLIKQAKSGSVKAQKLVIQLRTEALEARGLEGVDAQEDIEVDFTPPRDISVSGKDLKLPWPKNPKMTPKKIRELRERQARQIEEASRN